MTPATTGVIFYPVNLETKTSVLFDINVENR